MTKKRYMKLLMADGVSRDDARRVCSALKESNRRCSVIGMPIMMSYDKVLEYNLAPQMAFFDRAMKYPG